MNEPSSSKNLEAYQQAADRYRPARIKTLLIAESPPAFASGCNPSYFFFEQCPGGDILFSTVVRSLLSIKYRKADHNKKELLERLKDEGIWLIDVLESPVNRIDGRVTTDAEREAFINSNLDKFISRMKALQEAGHIDHDTDIILVKKVVADTIREPLKSAGFRIHKVIGFPRWHGDWNEIN